MPGSVRENTQDVIEFIKTHEITSILDVGAGCGTYGKIVRENIQSEIELDAVEIWPEYVEIFNLKYLYNNVYQQDARDISAHEFAGYDLVIFGDVLEHMSRFDSLKVWERASNARYGMISVPIVHYPQGALWNNPYEVHIQEHLHPEDLIQDYGPFILDKQYEVTGTFIKEFNASS